LNAFQDGAIGSTFAIRSHLDPRALAPAVRRVLSEAAPRAPIATMATLGEQLDASLVPERVIVFVGTLSASLALLLAALGIYGLIAYVVARRTPELGTRVALGARPASIVTLIGWQLIPVIAIGLLAGAGLAAWSEAIIAGVLEGFAYTPGSGIVTAALVLAAVAIVAVWPPLANALRVTPLVAMRHHL
jgi:ABC-type antimicrobial peptide transport system permease subunit